MGMSSYIMDLEDEFNDAVAEACGESEHPSEVLRVAMQHRSKVPHYTDDEIEEIVDEMWNEFWREYA